MKPKDAKCNKKGIECDMITEQERDDAFKSFWNIANFDLQNAQICSLVIETSVARNTIQEQTAC